MQFLVDVGNSRIKWARAGTDGPEDMSTRPHEGDPVSVLSCIIEGLDAFPDAIVLVDVSGQIGDSEVLDGLRRVQPTAHAAGVTNAYKNPGSLGADRWAALLGARSLTQAPVCVVDCGTAMTLDLMDGQGRHLGGAIAPGPDLQSRALDQGTARVRVAAPADAMSDSPLFGRDTASAVVAGTRLATVGFVTVGVYEAGRVLGADMRVLLTGGDAGRIAPHLTCAFEAVEDLVLRGAWVWAATP